MNNMLKFISLLCLSVSQLLPAATTTVSITDFKFTPVTVTIDIGDTVKWVNNGDAPHTSTSNVVGLWDKTMFKGNTFSRAFTAAGSFGYHCSFHQNMKATVIVRTPEQTRANIGKSLFASILPIKLNLTGKNANLAYWGSYIANAQSGCADCHSCPTYKLGNNPYRGQPKQFNVATYLAGGVSFSGGGLTVVSRNITPDITGKPGGLTLAAFKNLMRTGRGPSTGGAIIPVMPWPIYGMMSDYDLNALYEYLRAIPHAKTPVSNCAQPGQ